MSRWDAPKKHRTQTFPLGEGGPPPQAVVEEEP